MMKATQPKGKVEGVQAHTRPHHKAIRQGERQQLIAEVPCRWDLCRTFEDFSQGLGRWGQAVGCTACSREECLVTWACRTLVLDFLLRSKTAYSSYFFSGSQHYGWCTLVNQANQKGTIPCAGRSLVDGADGQDVCRLWSARSRDVPVL